MLQIKQMLSRVAHSINHQENVRHKYIIFPHTLKNQIIRFILKNADFLDLIFNSRLSALRQCVVSNYFDCFVYIDIYNITQHSSSH